MGVMVSIDWDFFVYNRAEAGEKSIAVIRDGKEQEISTSMLYDWRHKEKHEPVLQRILWMSRYAAFHRAGIDPKEEVKLYATPSPALFADVIGRRFRGMSDSPLWLSDSHAFGLEVAQLAVRRYARSLDRIVHFDAHHDLGYSEDIEEAWKHQGMVECSSWLYAALDAGLAKAADVVYPDWRNGQEKRPGNWAKHIARRVRYMTWSEWRNECKTTYRDVRTTHLCRSSSWTPPWLDAEFERLVRDLPWIDRVCFDCLPGGRRVGSYDACKRREWDDDAAIHFVEASSLEGAS